MRSRLPTALAALLLVGLVPGPAAAAKPEPTVTSEILEVLDDSCEDFFVVAGVTWTGFKADGAESVSGTYTELGDLDTIDGVQFSHQRKASKTGPEIIFASGPFPEGSRIGADVLLLYRGEDVGDTFVDFGTCT
jgi:hypothetical protein